MRVKRRIFVAKAERADTAQLEMEFAATLAALDRISGQLPLAEVSQPITVSREDHLNVPGVQFLHEALVCLGIGDERGDAVDFAEGVERHLPDLR